MTDGTGWVIEGFTPQMYWCGGRRPGEPIWSSSHLDAVRFVRQEDAQRVAALTLGDSGAGVVRWRVVEHVWGGPATTSYQALRVTTPCPTCGSTTLFVGSGGGLVCSYLGCPQPCVGPAVAALKGRAEACGKDHKLADQALNLAAEGLVDELVGELNRRVQLRNDAVRASLAAAVVGTVRQ
jgi:hypothetical protein